jgi:hypothetical protein
LGHGHMCAPLVVQLAEDIARLLQQLHIEVNLSARHNVGPGVFTSLPHSSPTDCRKCDVWRTSPNRYM